MARGAGVSYAQRLIALRMLRDGCRRSAIAKRLGVAASTVSALIDQAAVAHLADLERERQLAELDQLCDPPEL